MREHRGLAFPTRQRMASVANLDPGPLAIRRIFLTCEFICFSPNIICATAVFRWFAAVFYWRNFHDLFVCIALECYRVER